MATSSLGRARRKGTLLAGLTTIAIVVSSLAMPLAGAATAPSAPRWPKAETGNGSATVKWAAPSSTGGSPLTGYVVTPYIGSTAKSSVTFASTARTQVVTGLQNGTTYTFRVRARNAVGLSALSTATEPVTVGAPSKPRSPSATAGNNAATVKWNAPLTDNGASITGYVITPYLNGAKQAARSFSSTARTQVVGFLENAKYTFRIQARNARGLGDLSVATTVIVVGTPSAPRSPAAAGGSGQATVSWTAPATDNGSPITGYTVYPYKKGVAQTPRAFSSTARSQVITGLSNSTSYTFRVAATNARGIGPRSVATKSVFIGGSTSVSLPITNSTAAPGEYPSDSTTGYKACGLTVSQLTPLSGTVTLSSNQVLEGFDLAGNVVVAGSNVTIRCGRIRSTSMYGITSTRTGGESYVADGVEIQGTSTNSTSNSAAISPYGVWSVSRLNVWRFKDGIKLGSNHTIQDSWIHDLWKMSGSHNDGMQSVGGRNVSILRNNVEGPWQASTSALILGAGTGGFLENYTIEGNRLSGGGYTVYVGGKDGNPTPQNIKVRDNVWVQDSWNYGPHSTRLNWPAGDPTYEWTGNTYVAP